MEKVDSTISQFRMNIDKRMALVEMAIININETLKDISFDLKQFRNETREEFKSIRNEMNSDFKDVRKEMSSNLKWQFTFSIGGFSFLFSLYLGGMALMAHGFHWI
jgi:hypothetical protein